MKEKLKHSKKRESRHERSNTIATFTPIASDKIKSQPSLVSMFYGVRPTMRGAPKYGKYAREYFNIIGGVGRLNRSTSYCYGTRSVHYRPVSINAATAGRVAGHMNGEFAAVGAGSKHVTLSSLSATVGVIDGQSYQSLLSIQRGYSDPDTDDLYGCRMIMIM